MALVEYANRNFITDLNHVNFETCNAIATEFQQDPMAKYWGGPEWENYETDIVNIPEISRAHFCLCMFTMTCADLNAYTHFRTEYENFRNIFRYPKFGWCGFGIHIQSPRYILDVPCNDFNVDFTVITDKELNEFIKNQFELFSSLNSTEYTINFFRRMIADQGFYAECEIFERLRFAIEKNLGDI